MHMETTPTKNIKVTNLILIFSYCTPLDRNISTSKIPIVLELHSLLLSFLSTLLNTLFCGHLTNAFLNQSLEYI